jgi:hypothetical protein
MAESIANCALIISGIEAEIRYAHDGVELAFLRT